MEPTPELKAEARQLIGPGATDTELALFLHALMARAKELRAVLEPFERAAEFSPAVKAATAHAAAMREARRAADEARLNNTLAGKPMPVFREPSVWTRVKPAIVSALTGGVLGGLVATNVSYLGGSALGIAAGGLVAFAAGVLVTWGRK